MRRWGFPIAAILFAIAFLIGLALWMRGIEQVDVITRMRISIANGEEKVALLVFSSGGGAVGFLYQVNARPTKDTFAPPAPFWQKQVIKDPMPERSFWKTLTASRIGWKTIFHPAPKSPPGLGSTYQFMVYASWWQIELFLLVCCAGLCFLRRRGHRDPGTCPVCGYDMRATPDRCPECGTASSASAAA